ncbi:class I adenylate-forming enzyme family protein [Mycolicibacterium arseniciresistens]|uniref:Class I adenylate-forming enzyme family protein n=1 Tax=Mycolicibacterium arseniciresistens TaxID=3062257 RepID=A0ABT8UEQ5_9MYCO|nr:class I adenylate-forming enzyme family protein [Mycolicibacterium arseniciresistens]MDO3635651.1 class I adenylate-forming enzyme family protein [Mycolicibacterium arseniciresistens]
MPVDPQTIPALLSRQARLRGTHPLLVCDDDRLTYAEAADRSARLSRGLIALGAGKGTHVGVLYPNGPSFVVAALAAARIGATVVPFSTFVTARELGDQLRHSDVSILLSATAYRSHDYRERLAAVSTGEPAGRTTELLDPAVPNLRHVVFGLQSLDMSVDAVDDTLLAAMEDDVDGSDPLAIVYTSGSTGAPKGAVHTHAALLGHQHNLNAVRRYTADDTLFCNSPFFWIGGFAFALLATMAAGATLVCSNAEDPGVTLDLLERESPTLTNGFAAGVAHLARHPSFAGRNLSALRRGNLYPIMAPEVRPADPELRHNMLGMTEAGGVVLLSDDDTDQPEHRRGSFGRPAPGFDIQVVDPGTAAAVGTGEPGELWIRGPYLMQHYHRRSREDSFEPDGWFRTGDLVRTDADGFVYYLGRLGSMIKTAGANVAPAEVERAIARVTGVPAHVIGIPDADRGQLVAAVLTPDPGVEVDEAGLARRLSAELSSYKIPRRVVVLHRGEVPLLPSGKVDVGGLAEFFR